ncbi:hypothetical protein OE88DRAFT_806348 [Heliocybe sulcata]|uniref:F-box domain-containing protein n=1 Tax=Heliocybe sulcata TaxID=5364 RepID=A0A5C3MUK5_9AGAM|nr:hypothetical protein OE88DRAFT_806348 [Heliocybe sulcata]
MTVYDMPLEMLSRIACSIDSRPDLLSLAITCKSLYSIISPSHLQYHDIRTPLAMPLLWKRLAHHDDCHAPMIRSLTILYNNRAFTGLADLVGDAASEERLPEEYREPHGRGNAVVHGPFHEAELLRQWESDFMLALKRMKNLRRFRWYRRTPVIQGDNDIWSALNDLGTVKDVQFVDLQCRHGRIELNTPPIIASPSFLSLQGLSSLDVRKEELSSIATATDVTPLLTMLVQRCPDIQNLHLHLDFSLQSSGANIDFLIEHADWPNLRTLYLHGFRGRASLFSRFLDRHGSIESLTLSHMALDVGWRRLSLSDGALPNLLTVNCDSRVAAAILKNASVAANLRSLQWIDLEQMTSVDTYAAWDNASGEQDVEAGTYGSSVPPWSIQLAEAMMARPSIVTLGYRVRRMVDPTKLGEVLFIAPNVTELSIPGSASALFSEISAHSDLVRTSSSLTMQLEHIETKEHATKSLFRVIAVLFPKSSVIADPSVGLKAVIIQREEDGRVTWVRRRLNESSEARIFAWEDVYTA